MSNRYERRIDVLKEHKLDKDHKYHHHSRKKSYNNKRKANNQKKALKDFHKKMEKSKKIW